ncbi:kinase-like protein [Phaffia rhodozyma]|uniref:Kinase-like protein n=1 Tax=Phaffia rhodozyma TaxID=264483 RepID=A0A0F7SN12_PHARH|nr:kinase-like protein [Phaffia rhodozyma]
MALSTPPRKTGPAEGKKKKKKKTEISDFELMRVLGKGCAGKVLLVRSKATPGGKVFALKSIVKQLQHTLTEQSVLKRMSKEIRNPFVVHLHHSFHDAHNLFLVMDFHPGGDLATQLGRWGRFEKDRARFYAAEIVEGVQGLHASGIIYRDLKPENILLDQAGHLVLTDFGLSKDFSRKPISISPVTLGDGTLPQFELKSDFKSSRKRPSGEEHYVGDGALDSTNTFCGTAEYLAPEVIQGFSYTYNIDWWSFGTVLYEMLVGITPFYAPNHANMYHQVLHDKLLFPEDRPFDQDTKSLLRGLLQRNPALRLEEPRIKNHPYFSMIDWDHVYHKRYIPPYAPPTDENEKDLQNFDESFLDMIPSVEAEEGGGLAAAPSSQSAAAAAAACLDDRQSLFDGYSYRDLDTASIVHEEDGLVNPFNQSSTYISRTDFDIEYNPVSDKGAHIPTDLQSVICNHGHILDDPTSPTGSSFLSSEQRKGGMPFDRSVTLSAIGLVALAPSAVDGLCKYPVSSVEGLAEKNGTKGSTLLSRGVVDRYRFGLIKRRTSESLSRSENVKNFSRDGSDKLKSSRTILRRTNNPEPVTPSYLGTPAPSKDLLSVDSSSSRRGLSFRTSSFNRQTSSSTNRNLSATTDRPHSLIISTSSFRSDFNRSSSPRGTPFSTSNSSRFLPQRSTSGLSLKRRVDGRSTVTLSVDENDPFGMASPTRISSGQKIKKYSKAGSEKVKNLFNKN